MANPLELVLGKRFFSGKFSSNLIIRQASLKKVQNQYHLFIGFDFYLLNGRNFEKIKYVYIIN